MHAQNAISLRLYRKLKGFLRFHHLRHPHVPTVGSCRGSQDMFLPPARWHTRTSNVTHVIRKLTGSGASASIQGMILTYAPMCRHPESKPRSQAKIRRFRQIRMSALARPIETNQAKPRTDCSRMSKKWSPNIVFCILP